MKLATLWFCFICSLSVFSQKDKGLVTGDVTCMEFVNSKTIYYYNKAYGIQLKDLNQNAVQSLIRWDSSNPVNEIVQLGSFIYLQTFWKIYKFDFKKNIDLSEVKILLGHDSLPIYSFIKFDNRLILSNDLGVFESNDGGNRWTKIWEDIPDKTNATPTITNFSTNAIVKLAINPYDNVLYAVSGAGYIYKYEMKKWKQIYKFPTRLFTATFDFDSNFIYLKGSYCSIQVLDKKTNKPFKIALSDGLKRDGFLLERTKEDLFLYDNSGKKYQIFWDIQNQKSRVELVSSKDLIYKIYKFNGMKFYCTNHGIYLRN